MRERRIDLSSRYQASRYTAVRLHRIMGTLRRNHRALRSRGYFFYCFDQAHLQKGVIAFRREATPAGAQPAESLIVFLNFSDTDAEVWLPFPTPGTWAEIDRRGRTKETK